IAIRDRVLQLPQRLVEPDRPGRPCCQRDRPLTGAAAELENIEAADVPEDNQLRFGYPPRPPRERATRQVTAMDGLVVVGVGVPELAVVALVRMALAHAESMSFSRASRCFFHSSRKALRPALAAEPADRTLVSISSASVENASPMPSTASSICLAAFFPLDRRGISHATPYVPRAVPCTHNREDELAVTDARIDLKFVDADGHVLEHPDKMLEYAPEEYRDRIWHIETDDDGNEWVVWDGSRDPANYFALAGAGGMSTDEQAKIAAGERKYTELRPGAFEPEPRIADLDTERISQTVLYPTT